MCSKVVSNIFGIFTTVFSGHIFHTGGEQPPTIDEAWTIRKTSELKGRSRMPLSRLNSGPYIKGFLTSPRDPITLSDDD